jgi:hypothetical protein
MPSGEAAPSKLLGALEDGLLLNWHRAEAASGRGSRGTNRTKVECSLRLTESDNQITLEQVELHGPLLSETMETKRVYPYA